MVLKTGRDLHSALKTNSIGSIRAEGLQLVLMSLQWAKDEVAFSLHAAPNQWSTSGLQLTDALSYLGFQRQVCPFVETQEGYCDWVDDDIDLTRFAQSISQTHRHLLEGQRHLEACGLQLPQPEGYGYFFGKQGSPRVRTTARSGDGHTSPKTQLIKTAEDNGFSVCYDLDGGRGR